MRRPVLLALASLALLLPLTTSGGTATARDTGRGSTGLLVTFRAWGPLHRGMTPREAQRTGMVSTRLDRCAPGYQLTAPFASRAYLVWKANTKPWTVQWIVVHGAADHTATGIHPGSTLGRLRQQYPRLSRVKHSSAFGGGGFSGSKDVYAAAVTRRYGSLTFQFPYGPRPGPGTRVESIVVSKKPAVFLGC